MRIAVPPELDPAALADWDACRPVVEIGGPTMGTTWRARFARPDGCDLVALEQAIAALFERLIADLSHWEPASALSRFNDAAPASWHLLPPDLAAVIEAALDVAQRSDGAFDPAIGTLADLWGFGPRGWQGAPDLAAVRAAARGGSSHGLIFDPERARLYQPGGVRLDLSGIAKGHAVDRLSALLTSYGIRHHLIEIGGELAGCGLRPDGDPWWVELETPAPNIAPLRVALHQCAAATSGDYVRGRHTIDPASGRPVADVLAVSVVHRSAMLADAWATALIVTRPAARAELAIANDLPVRLLYRGAGGIAEWISPALAAMIAD